MLHFFVFGTIRCICPALYAPPPLLLGYARVIKGLRVLLSMQNVSTPPFPTHASLGFPRFGMELQNWYMGHGRIEVVYSEYMQ